MLESYLDKFCSQFLNLWGFTPWHFLFLSGCDLLFVRCYIPFMYFVGESYSIGIYFGMDSWFTRWLFDGCVVGIVRLFLCTLSIFGWIFAELVTSFLSGVGTLGFGWGVTGVEPPFWFLHQSEVSGYLLTFRLDSYFVKFGPFIGKHVVYYIWGISFLTGLEDYQIRRVGPIDKSWDVHWVDIADNVRRLAWLAQYYWTYIYLVWFICMIGGLLTLFLYLSPFNSMFGWLLTVVLYFYLLVCIFI